MSLEIRQEYFRNRAEWRQWLDANHAEVTELWIIYYKKHTGKKSIIYREALEEALCFGWIDGMIRRIDEERYMQRFTPRRKNSNWSELNKRLAIQLEKEGRMHASGIKFRDKWVAAKPEEAMRNISVTSYTEWEEVLDRFPLAASEFAKLAPLHQRRYLLWITEARRPETRQKRMAEAVALLEKGEKLGMK